MRLLSYLFAAIAVIAACVEVCCAFLAGRHLVCWILARRAERAVVAEAERINRVAAALVAEAEGGEAQ